GFSIIEAIEVNINNIQATNEDEDSNLSICSKEVINSNLFNCIYCEDRVIRRYTYLCDYARFYDSKSKKDTITKKINCPFLVNTSCPKTNNPESHVYINKIVDKYNHFLSVKIINFEESKKFISEIMDDIKFLTLHCKFSAIVQYKFLEGKYPTHLIHSKNLYATIQKFRPTTKILSNNTALMSNWLDGQKEIDFHSHIESVNGCLKQLLHSSNVLLNELINEIHWLLDLQDKKEKYNIWKLAISCIKSQEKTNFFFKKVDESLERVLMPNILQKFMKEIDESSEDLFEEEDSDKKNQEFMILNPKKRRD
ncbi:20053_t:CDS:2, partial [Gigaspora margarita]